MTDREELLEVNTRAIAEGKRPAKGSPILQGITKAYFTQFGFLMQNAGTFAIGVASGSAQGGDSITTANMPTGGNVILTGVISYNTST